MTYFHHFFQTTDGVLAGYCDQWLAKLVFLDRYFVLCLLPFLVHDLTIHLLTTNSRRGWRKDDLQMKIELQYSTHQVSRGPTVGKEAKRNKRKARARKRVKEENEYEERIIFTY